MVDIAAWLVKLKDARKLIIVEGKKDRLALESFGITDIFTLEGKALFEAAEQAAQHNAEVIILTDLDSKGKELYAKLRAGLTRLGIKVDTFFREWLFRNTDLRQIEGLVQYARKHDIAQ